MSQILPLSFSECLFLQTNSQPSLQHPFLLDISVWPRNCPNFLPGCISLAFLSHISVGFQSQAPKSHMYRSSCLCSCLILAAATVANQATSILSSTSTFTRLWQTTHALEYACTHKHTHTHTHTHLEGQDEELVENGIYCECLTTDSIWLPTIGSAIAVELNWIFFTLLQLFGGLYMWWHLLAFCLLPNSHHRVIDSGTLPSY